ncbi:fimbrial protein [Burkholderia sp. BCC1630]|uniref:fimbrial protein n=1 Tax=Burkholderia sp. BCC1630 TaxID=2676304 RepID=UPI00158B607A|nr:fimbrial protein [Burkholderia sp. BCC1630]
MHQCINAYASDVVHHIEHVDFDFTGQLNQPIGTVIKGVTDGHDTVYGNDGDGGVPLKTDLVPAGASKNIPSAGVFDLGGGLGLALGIRKNDSGSAIWLAPGKQSLVRKDVSALYGAKLIYEIEVIGPIKAGSYGPIDGGDFTGMADHAPTRDNPLGFEVSLMVNFELSGPTCKIQSIPTVNMGNDISLSKFTGPGTKSDPQPFTVQLTCPAGITKLSYLMKESGGSHVDPSQPGTLSLSNANGASGVGVQVKDKDNNDTPVNFENTPVSQYKPDQDNQHIDLHFEAAYIQTGAKVTGGEADAQATITMSYE